MSAPDEAAERSHGRVFDGLAEAYDRHRPAYPDHLVNRACALAGLGPGSPVLEIGCGTGQLTRSLLARGLRVTAVEPGARLAALARERLRGAGDLTIVNARFEDAQLPGAAFAALFAATAIHWVDPDIGWQRVADALVPGGTLALMQHFGLDEPEGIGDQRRLLALLAAVAPELAAVWPPVRDLATTLEGARERGGNVSAVWSWLSGWDLARDDAAHLFEDTQIAVEPQAVEQSAAEVLGVLGTMSFWSRLSADQRGTLESAIPALEAELGRPFRSSIVAVLVSARRT